MESLALSFRICLGLVFVAAGGLKFQDLGEFRRVVADYRVLPAGLVAPVAGLLPPLELAAGVALLAGVVTRPVAAAVLAALAAFAIAVTLNLARGRRVDCGCFSVGSSRSIGWPLLARDGALMAMSTLVAIRPPSALAPAAGSTLSSSEAVAVALATGVSLLVLLVLAEARRVIRTVRAVERTEVPT